MKNDSDEELETSYTIASEVKAILEWPDVIGERNGDPTRGSLGEKSVISSAEHKGPMEHKNEHNIPSTFEDEIDLDHDVLAAMNWADGLVAPERDHLSNLLGVSGVECLRLLVQTLKTERSQRKLAEMLGIGSSQISKLLNGTCSEMRDGLATTVRKWAVLKEKPESPVISEKSAESE